jgi:membrane-bound lytic murein transglycosylase D
MEEPIPMTIARAAAVAPPPPRAPHAARLFVPVAAAAALWLAGCAAVPAEAPRTPDPAPAPIVLAPPAAPAAAPVPAAAAPIASRPDAADAIARAATEADERWNARAVDDVAGAVPDDARQDLWQRVREGFAVPDLAREGRGELVARWERYYAERAEYVARMTSRGGRYLFHIVEEVQQRGMPMELALLPFIESAFNPQAVSSARAAGIWQFMPATGRDFELRQNLFRDDRRDVLHSTRAALDYLGRLHRMFGDWHLALAAYNWGQGNVMRAIERNRRAGLPTDYASLRMPDETRNYVPKLQAVENIVARPEAFGLSLPALENHPFFLSVAIERDIDVALAARLAGVEPDEFQALNPQMNKPVILAAGTPRVLLPYDAANRFVANLAAHRGPLASWTAWVAPRTLPPAEAAKLVGMHEDELRSVNRIPPRMLVRTGSTLLVPRAAHATADVAESIADNATLLLTSSGRPPRRVAFKAGRQGDTVAAIAKRYRVSVAQVADWNDTTPQARFKPGQTVVVYVAPRPAARRSASSRKAAAGTRAAPSAKAPARQAAPAKR